ncbi:MAG: hypothetical protein GX761_13895 [Gammaproteobacteria bacterium]|nr:hypothetical protein [Gammaproteobacteria bacterium]
MEVGKKTRSAKFVLLTLCMKLIFLVPGVAWSYELIKSTEDLHSYLQSTEQHDNPFNKLSLPAKSEFISSLKFCEGEISSLNYAILESELSFSEVYEVLSLFNGNESLLRSIPEMWIFSGLSPERTEDFAGTPFTWIDDHKCELNGLCYPSPGNKCNSHSCRIIPSSEETLYLAEQSLSIDSGAE